MWPNPQWKLHFLCSECSYFFNLKIISILLTCMSHGSSRSLLEYNQDPTFLTNQGWLWPLQSTWNIKAILCSVRLVLEGKADKEITEPLHSVRLVLEGKAGKEITKPSRFKLLEKFSANNFPLSVAEDNKLSPLYGGGSRFTFAENTISNHWKCYFYNSQDG